MNHRYMYAEIYVLVNQNDRKVYDCMSKFQKSRKFQMSESVRLLFERINRLEKWYIGVKKTNPHIFNYLFTTTLTLLPW